MPSDLQLCKDFYTHTLVPGLIKMQAILPGVPCVSPDNSEHSWPLHVLMCAISGTESAWTARVQSGNGPAHGLFQFERAGVSAVYYNRVAGPLLRRALQTGAYDLRDWGHGPSDIWYCLREPAADSLAVLVARLNLFSDPRALPALPDQSGMFAYYTHNWRPGKPSPERFWESYTMAVTTVTADGSVAAPVPNAS